MNEQIREQIKTLINSIKPFDQIEKDHIDDAIKWIDSGIEIFRTEKPATPPKHLVAFTVFVDPSVGKVLLLEHKKAQLLLPNGGHVDLNELPYNTALREVKEEMNEIGEFLFDEKTPFFLDQMVTVGLTSGHTDVTTWYVFNRDSKLPINDQSKEFKEEFERYYWLTFDEILKIEIQRLNSNMHRFVKKLKSELNI